MKMPAHPAALVPMEMEIVKPVILQVVNFAPYLLEMCDGAHPIVQITVPIMSVGLRPHRSIVNMPQVVNIAQAT